MRKYSKILKSSVFVIGLMAFGLAPAAQSFAENKHKNYKSYSRPRDNRHYDDRRYDNRHHDRHHYNRNVYYRHHRDHGGEVALGILTGGLLFYALTNNSRNDRYYERPARTVYVQQQPVYVQPQQQQWVGRQPVQPQNTNGSCLQIREYQTTITVGGQSVPAYGQSCLQPDGTWKLGPAIPEPSY